MERTLSVVAWGLDFSGHGQAFRRLLAASSLIALRVVRV